MHGVWDILGYQIHPHDIDEPSLDVESTHDEPCTVTSDYDLSENVILDHFFPELYHLEVEEDDDDEEDDDEEEDCENTTDVTTPPALQFINGKQQVTTAPKDTKAEEARSDQIESLAHSKNGTFSQINETHALSENEASGTVQPHGSIEIIGETADTPKTMAESSMTELAFSGESEVSTTNKNLEMTSVYGQSLSEMTEKVIQPETDFHDIITKDPDTFFFMNAEYSGDFTSEPESNNYTFSQTVKTTLEEDFQRFPAITSAPSSLPSTTTVFTGMEEPMPENAFIDTGDTVQENETSVLGDDYKSTSRPDILLLMSSSSSMDLQEGSGDVQELHSKSAAVVVKSAHTEKMPLQELVSDPEKPIPTKHSPYISHKEADLTLVQGSLEAITTHSTTELLGGERLSSIKNAIKMKEEKERTVDTISAFKEHITTVETDKLLFGNEFENFSDNVRVVSQESTAHSKAILVTDSPSLKTKIVTEKSMAIDEESGDGSSEIWRKHDADLLRGATSKVVSTDSLFIDPGSGEMDIVTRPLTSFPLRPGTVNTDTQEKERKILNTEASDVKNAITIDPTMSVLSTISHRQTMKIRTEVRGSKTVTDNQRSLKHEMDTITSPFSEKSVLESNEVVTAYPTIMEEKMDILKVSDVISPVETLMNAASDITVAQRDRSVEPVTTSPESQSTLPIPRISSTILTGNVVLKEGSSEFTSNKTIESAQTESIRPFSTSIFAENVHLVPTVSGMESRDDDGVVPVPYDPIERIINTKFPFIEPSSESMALFTEPSVKTTVLSQLLVEKVEIETIKDENDDNRITLKYHSVTDAPAEVDKHGDNVITTMNIEHTKEGSNVSQTEEASLELEPRGFSVKPEISSKEESASESSGKPELTSRGITKDVFMKSIESTTKQPEISSVSTFNSYLEEEKKDITSGIESVPKNLSSFDKNLITIQNIGTSTSPATVEIREKWLIQNVYSTEESSKSLSTSTEYKPIASGINNTPLFSEQGSGDEVFTVPSTTVPVSSATLKESANTLNDNIFHSKSLGVSFSEEKINKFDTPPTRLVEDSSKETKSLYATVESSATTRSKIIPVASTTYARIKDSETSTVKQSIPERFQIQVEDYQEKENLTSSLPNATKRIPQGSVSHIRRHEDSTYFSELAKTPKITSKPTMLSMLAREGSGEGSGWLDIMGRNSDKLTQLPEREITLSFHTHGENYSEVVNGPVVSMNGSQTVLPSPISRGEKQILSTLASDISESFANESSTDNARDYEEHTQMLDDKRNYSGDGSYSNAITLTRSHDGTVIDETTIIDADHLKSSFEKVSGPTIVDNKRLSTSSEHTATITKMEIQNTTPELDLTDGKSGDFENSQENTVTSKPIYSEFIISENILRSDDLGSGDAPHFITETPITFEVLETATSLSTLTLSRSTTPFATTPKIGEKDKVSQYETEHFGSQSSTEDISELQTLSDNHMIPDESDIVSTTGYSAKEKFKHDEKKHIIPSPTSPYLPVTTSEALPTKMSEESTVTIQQSIIKAEETIPESDIEMKIVPTEFTKTEQERLLPVTETSKSLVTVHLLNGASEYPKEIMSNTSSSVDSDTHNLIQTFREASADIAATYKPPHKQPLDDTNLPFVSSLKPKSENMVTERISVFSGLETEMKEKSSSSTEFITEKEGTVFVEAFSEEVKPTIFIHLGTEVLDTSSEDDASDKVKKLTQLDENSAESDVPWLLTTPSSVPHESKAGSIFGADEETKAWPILPPPFMDTTFETQTTWDGQKEPTTVNSDTATEDPEKVIEYNKHTRNTEDQNVNELVTLPFLVLDVTNGSDFLIGTGGGSVEGTAVLIPGKS